MAKNTNAMETFLLHLTCRELASLSPELAIAASIAVVVVPIFDPSVRG